MNYIEVVNFDKYQQHGRTKQWIKIWKKILNDFKFCQLTNSERWLFIGLIILATEHENTLPKDPYWVYQRVAKGEPKGRYRVDIGLKNMLKLGLIRIKTGAKIREENIRKEKEEDKTFKNFYPTASKVLEDKLRNY